MNDRLRFRLLLSFLSFVLCMSPLAQLHAQQQDDFYTGTSQLLQKYVQGGEVNYKALHQNQAQLQKLVQQVGGYKLVGASEAEQKAFYLNAYNLLVLHQVLQHYPLKSVMDVPGFFDRRQFRVAGEQLTLNQLEKKKLLAPFQDARVHFALVCAARSCPPLLNTAYTPERVEEQLESQTRKALQDLSFIQVKPSGKTVQISELFNWYRDDFLKKAPSVAAYINGYRSNPLPAGYKVGYYTYDWKLNDSSD
ncbi:DUF547 domain-containing protein [Pontibacter sp. CAU 1760]